MMKFHRAVAYLLSASAGVLLLAGTARAAGDGLAPPVRLLSGGNPIDVEIGHAAPYLHDFDGDGRRDLLVGQFGSGKLRIYRNVGTDRQPAYDGFVYFKAGGTEATVPAG